MYRLEEGSGDDVIVSTDKVWIRRPFESRLETWSGAPPGDERASYQVSAFGLLESGSADGATSVLAVAPAVAASDVRVLPMLEAALDEGFLVPKGKSEVLGRACDVFRSRDPLGAGPLRKPTADEYADSCIDEDGLLLEEENVVGGKRLSRRVAVEVDEHADGGDQLFETGTLSFPVDKGGGSVRRIAPDSSPPGDFYVLDRPPSGFEHRSRLSVVPPQPENFGDPLRESFIRASVADVWVRGDDVLIVDQGGTLRGSPPFQQAPDRPRVDLGALGKGEIVFDARGNRVRVLLNNGRYISVEGTLPTDELVAIARRLHKTKGTEMKFLDPEPERKASEDTTA